MNKQRRKQLAEGLQQAERGQQMESAVDTIDGAMELLDGIGDELQELAGGE